MKLSRIAVMPLVALVLPFYGCATLDAAVGPSNAYGSSADAGASGGSAQEVSVASELSAAQAAEMRLVDRFTCKQDIGMASESLCLSQLKDQTFRAGGQLVVIESKNPIPCRSAADQGPCYTMNGAAYARKTQTQEGRHAYGNEKRSWMDVQVVSELNTNEKANYRDLGSISCRQDITLGTAQHPSTPEESCRVRMQSQAYDKGGDVLVIESKETIACSHPRVDKGPCVSMTGRIWKDKRRR